MSRPASLLDHAVEVARQLESFGAYQRSPIRARRALRRRVPGFSDQQYDQSIEKARHLFAVTRELVAVNEAELMLSSRTKGTTWNSYPKLLMKSAPGFPREIYEAMIGWVVFWYHLK